MPVSVATTSPQAGGARASGFALVLPMSVLHSTMLSQLRAPSQRSSTYGPCVAFRESTSPLTSFGFTFLWLQVTLADITRVQTHSARTMWLSLCPTQFLLTPRLRGPRGPDWHSGGPLERAGVPQDRGVNVPQWEGAGFTPGVRFLPDGLRRRLDGISGDNSATLRIHLHAEVAGSIGPLSIGTPCSCTPHGSCSNCTFQ